MVAKREVKATATGKVIRLEASGPVTRADNVRARLRFAERRLDELSGLSDGDLSSADAEERQQLVQEFFFHLVGAVGFLAQVVNSEKALEIPIDRVSVRTVCKKLGSDDPIRALLVELHPDTGEKSEPPDDWYSDEGCHYRIVVLRNRVSHHGNNPFFFSVGAGLKTSTHLFLDPRQPQRDRSERPAIEELNRFLQLVDDKCAQVIECLQVAEAGQWQVGIELKNHHAKPKKR